MNDLAIKTVLRRFRRSYGFTQEELSELMGLKDRSELSRIERGERPLRLEQLIRLKIIFDASLKDIAPKIWMRALNGLWEGTQTVIDVCSDKKSSGAREKCSFLKSAQERVEALETK